MTWKRVSGFWNFELCSAAERYLLTAFHSRHRPPPRTLEDLPVEVLEEIFRLACADGGRTGCSLSLVSKFVNAVARAGRFHSLHFLSGSLWQLETFGRCWRAACATAKRDGTPKPRTHHLCVVVTIGSLRYCSPLGGKLTKLDEGIRAHRDVLLDHLSEEEVQELHASLSLNYRRLLNKLLDTFSADLETLCLIRGVGADTWGNFGDLLGGEPYDKYEIYCNGFPNLRELSFSDVEPVLLPFPDAASHPRKPFCPKLKRLCTVTWLFHGPLSMPHWTYHAPNLEYLRITHSRSVGLSHSENCLSALQSALGHESRSSAWPNLKELLVLFETDSYIRKEAPDLADRHLQVVKELFEFIVPRVPVALCVPWYEKQDIRHKVGGWLSFDMSNAKMVWLDWLHRIRGGCGAYVPDFWEDRLERWMQKNMPKPHLWERLLGTMGVHADGKVRADEQKDWGAALYDAKLWRFYY
ncbi:hypothetical protein BV20DRAFT_975567 [Pilatotrama ljubarskyi]|nr:hypothetical protein BV20DRAFT_975567 [Pilatotrama ljubarskyi]